MKIYTKSGDDGTTGTLGQGRCSKSDLLIHVLGEIDELSAVLSQCSDVKTASITSIVEIQSRLLDLGAEIASLSADSRYLVREIESDIKSLEAEIDQMDGQLPALTNFILPGGTADARHLHIARAVCRRAERALVELTTQEPTLRPESVKYLNRLSDWLFVRARLVNSLAGIEDQIWVKKND